MKKSIVTLLTAGLIAASMSMTVFAGEWQYNNEEWQYQNDDGTYANNGWHWIDGRCYYFEGAYRNIDNAYCILDCNADGSYTVDASGAWVFNGTVVEENSELAQKLLGDNFSGTYISTYLEVDWGNFEDNSYRLEISMATEDNMPPYFYLTEYDKNANGSWSRANSGLNKASQSLDKDGNPILIVEGQQTGSTIAQIVKNGDTLQMTMDESRTTYQKQN